MRQAVGCRLPALGERGLERVGRPVDADQPRLGEERPSDRPRRWRRNSGCSWPARCAARRPARRRAAAAEVGRRRRRLAAGRAASSRTTSGDQAFSCRGHWRPYRPICWPVEKAQVFANFRQGSGYPRRPPQVSQCVGCSLSRADRLRLTRNAYANVRARGNTSSLVSFRDSRDCRDRFTDVTPARPWHVPCSIGCVAPRQQLPRAFERVSVFRASMTLNRPSSVSTAVRAVSSRWLFPCCSPRARKPATRARLSRDLAERIAAGRAETRPPHRHGQRCRRDRDCAAARRAGQEAAARRGGPRSRRATRSTR